MNILYVTFEKPSKKSGGGLVILQSLISMSTNNEIYYVGPEFNVSEYPNIKLKECHFLKTEYTILNKIKYHFKSIPNHYFNSWEKISEELVRRIRFDLCHVEFTRYSDVVHFAKQHNLKTNVRVHNIEFDYYKKMMQTKGLNKRKLSAFTKLFSVKEHEAYVMREADKLIYLTKTDKETSIRYYGNRENDIIVPVCLIDSTNHDVAPYRYMGKYILMTGSYWYSPNAKGAIWFLEEIWSQIQDKLDDVGLVIAGSKPNQDLRSACEKFDSCVLIDSPEDIIPYFLGASLYIAPIFDGAGMKVKVAEALSYGLPLIGTKHALIGYEKAMGVCIQADEAKEYREAIVKLFTSESGMVTKQEVRNVFDTNYSIGASIEAFSAVI